MIKSQTDQIGKGRKIPLPYKNDAYCPIKALMDWKSVCDAETPRGLQPSATPELGVWRRINIQDQLIGALKTTQYYELIKKYCQRIGFVTQADLSGASISMIQKTTGHRSEAMVRNYIRDPEGVLKNHAGQHF